MKFGEKYELLESLTTGAVETFVANDKIRGQRVLVHILQCDPQKPNQTTAQWVLGAFRQVAPEPAGFVLETGKYSGTLYAYLVTKLPDDATIRAWVQQYKIRAANDEEILAGTARPSNIQPPSEIVQEKQQAPRKVEEFTDFFGLVRPPGEESSPSSEGTGKDSPTRKVGDFTAVFPSLPSPGEKSPPSSGGTGKDTPTRKVSDFTGLYRDMLRPPAEKSSPASGKTGKDAPNSTPARASNVGPPPLDLCCGAPEEFEQTAKPSKITQVDVEVVRVLFATDRGRTGRSEPKKFFWNERAENGELSLGVCEVSIPKSDRHKLGGLEKPSIYRLEFREDPNKHVVLVGVQTKGEEDFVAELQERVARSERKEAFIFIHGYDNTFEDAACRAGQFAYDLQFDGVPILYSWPSLGKWWRYAADETNVTWTVPHLESFLGSVVAKSGARTVHLIAHSMGNRALTSALELLVAKKSLPAGMLRHIVLTAPDIDSETFNQLAVAIAPAGERLTMYSNHRDRALRLSKLFHFYKRAGSTILVVRGMDTIDASAVDTSFTHHSYFGSSRTLLADLSSLLSEGKPPNKRFGMRERMTEKGAYYVFRP
jgi:esterase/lipase superfamily enzyme